MLRISMTFISLMAAFVLSASMAHAGSVVVHTTTPNVKVQVPHTNIGSQSSGAGAGKVTFNPFHVTKTIDKSSNTLSQGVYSGKHYTAGKGGGATPYDDKQKGGKSEMFLKLDGVAGESKDDTHKSE